MVKKKVSKKKNSVNRNLIIGVVVLVGLLLIVFGNGITGNVVDEVGADSKSFADYLMGIFGFGEGDPVDEGAGDTSTSDTEEVGSSGDDTAADPCEGVICSDTEYCAEGSCWDNDMSCTGGACPSYEYCNSDDECVPNRIFGDSCSADDECDSGVCADMGGGIFTCVYCDSDSHCPSEGDPDEFVRCAEDNFCYECLEHSDCSGICDGYGSECIHFCDSGSCGAHINPFTNSFTIGSGGTSPEVVGD